jgi:hypothetical protein
LARVKGFDFGDKFRLHSTPTDHVVQLKPVFEIAVVLGHIDDAPLPFFPKAVVLELQCKKFDGVK